MHNNIMQRQNSKPGYSKSSNWQWFGLLLGMLVVAAYFVSRYQGQWAENDSAVFTKVIKTFTQEGQLLPTDQNYYPNGYGYQAISDFIITVTGLDVTTLQQLVYPFFAALVILLACLLFRELIGSWKGATIAALLLFTQPEFLFVILRSSHEKFSRILLLLSLYWLVRSFQVTGRGWLFAAHIVLFYITVYGLTASNTFLSNSFIFAVVVALIIGWLLSKSKSYLWQDIDGQRTLRRLFYVSVICLILVFVFTSYIYTPSRNSLLILKTMIERIAALFLDVQANASDSYSQLSTAWISLPVYFLVSVGNWIILVCSFTIWLVNTYQWFWLRQKPNSHANLLLWLLYTAFAAQGVLSIISDASGVIGNLQQRVFPNFSIMAVAMIGSTLANWKPANYVSLIRYGISFGVFCLVILSTLKATNEPLLSNKWTFYQKYEITALDWNENYTSNTELWTEFDERLSTAYTTVRGDLKNGNRFSIYTVKSSTENILLTDITKLRSARLKQPLPVPLDALRIYDNGSAQIFRFRPQTPFQDLKIGDIRRNANWLFNIWA